MIRVSSDLEDQCIAIGTLLRRYRSMVSNYQACKDLYESLYPSNTQHFSDMPKSQSSDTFEPERWAQRRMDQEERMKVSLEGMRVEYENVEKIIDKLTGDYNTVLTRRYLLNESYEIIADKMHYSVRTVKYLHNRSIQKLCTLLH